MSRIRNIYVCSSCGYNSPKWLGKCPECNSWNTFVEDAVDNETYKKIESAPPKVPTKITQTKKAMRLKTNISEVDLVLGGGIISGGLTLLSGNPGIGKSTLTLQIASAIEGDTLILSAEESEDQITDRMERLGLADRNISLLGENNLDIILSTIATQKPTLAIVDSVQTIYSESVTGIAGNPTQVRHVAESLLHLAKSKNIAILLIGHVTKDGNLAGPRSLEHLVDSVFLLEGESSGAYRMLRSVKNRFGSTDDIGVFEMTEKGLAEVKNPSEAFLSGRSKNAIGSTITSICDGGRSFLLEVQALTSPTSFGYPKRTSSGIPQNRSDIMVAVLQRYANIKLQGDDIFLNVVGGFKINENACDLATVLALASSKKKFPLPHDMLVLGEVGLSGEIRPVRFLEKRLKEAEKCGFKSAIIPHGTAPKTKLEIKQYRFVSEMLADMLK